MKRLRDPNWALIFIFLGIIALVPIVQTIKEVGSDEGLVALEVFSQAPTAANLRAFEKRLEENTWAAKASRPWVQLAQFSWLKYGGEKAVLGLDGWFFFKPGLAYMVSRDPSPAAKGTNDPVAAIVHFKQQLAAQGIQLLLMPVPNKESIYPDRLSARVKPGQAVMSPRTREYMKRLRAEGVEIVDLFGEFGRARQEQGADLYLAQDTHWSPRGVDLAAKAVAKRLGELGWVGAGSTNYQAKATNAVRLGDIVRMLQAPKIEQSITPETVSCSQVVRGEGQLYTDDPNAEVLVLGDSFMRIYQTDAPLAAGFISHLAKELKQPVFSFVNDGGGATLVREELAIRPILLQKKKVVVWEFVERDFGIAVKGWPKIELPPVPANTRGPAVQN